MSAVCVRALRLCLAALAGSALMLSPTAHAGTNQWTSGGPYGGLVTVIAIDPQTPTNMYAAGFSGVFKSSDGGASWSRAGNGIKDPSVAAIAVDPVTPTTLYAGSVEGGQLVKSVDGAGTWVPVGPTLVIAIAVDPKTPSIVYASQKQSGLLKSTDGGVTWNKVSVASAPSFPTFNTIAIDPKTPTTVYAGESSSGIYKSVDGGASWAPANTGLTGPIVQVLGFAIDPQTPANLYATANTTGGSGLFKSTDGGASWNVILADKTSAIGVYAVTVDPQTPSTVYLGTFSSGVMKSTNGGTSFAGVNTGLSKFGVNAIAVNPQNTSAVFAGTQNGIYATANAGGSWSGASNGLALTSVNALTVDPQTATTIYAGTKYSGIYKSVDGGDSWASVYTGLGSTGNLACAVPEISSLAINPSTPATLYAGTRCTLNSQVLKSVDGGATWAPLKTGIPAYVDVNAVAVDPQAPTTVYAGSNTASLFKSVDGGATWSVVAGLSPGEHINAVSIAPLPPSVGSGSIMAVAAEGDGAFVSTDGGATFQAISTVSQSSKTSGAKRDHELCDQLDRMVVIGLLSGLSQVNVSQTRLALLCDSGSGFEDTAFVLFIGLSAFLGEKAQAMAGRPPLRATVQVGQPQVTAWGVLDGNAAESAACAPPLSVVFNPTDDNGFFAGTSCGVLKGTNNGQQLVSMNAGLPTNTQITAMAITPSGSDIYAGAAPGGVFRFTAGAAVSPAKVVEFYNAALDHYFISINPQEISDLDTGVHVGWARTGLSFNAYASASGAANPVCRFYIPPQHGDSHFFSADPNECAAVLAKIPVDPNYSGYDYEAPNVFYIDLPDTTTGACPAGTIPVFRLWNQRADSNHRYTTDSTVRAQMIARGYASEGYGPQGVAMCAVQ